MYSEIEASSTFDRKSIVLYKIVLYNYPLNIARIKKVELKRWNLGLLALVALLLILAIIATVNIIINQYSTEKMVFGSWSDWFNTAGTLGTFAIAAMAYRKAPDWIKQRKHENALDMAQKFMVDDVSEIIRLMNMALFKVSDLEWKFDILSTDAKDFVTITECEENFNLFKNPLVTPITIDIDLSKLRKLGWHIDENAKFDLDTMSQKYYRTQRHYCALWSDLQKYVKLETNYTSQEIQDVCNKRIDIIKKMNKSFNIRKESFENKYDTFDMYFTIKTK